MIIVVEGTVKMAVSYTHLVVISDNGIGTDSIEEVGLGLKSIRERINELNGEVKFLSKDNEGFKLSLIHIYCSYCIWKSSKAIHAGYQYILNSSIAQIIADA